MSWDIIKRKNGNYDVYSNISGGFFLRNTTRARLIAFYSKTQAEQAKEFMTDWLTRIDTEHEARKAKRS